MVDEVANTIMTLAEKNGNRFDIECPDDGRLMVCDLTKVRQVLFNLLSNACKFTENGTITLHVEFQHHEDTDWVEYRVADSGIGMTPEQLNKVFEAFTQADTSTTRNFGGTGLGLAITKNFAQMLNGNIAVVSELGKGSTFTLRWPLTAALEGVVAAEEAQAFDADDSKMLAVNAKTILVVDDDAVARDLLSRHLNRAGYRVKAATSGEEAIRMARDIKPDAITLDILMPQMDGWAVLAALKDDPETEKIPITMLSIIDDRRIGSSLGASDYLTKPIDREKLLAVLARLCPEKTGMRVLVVDDDSNSRDLVRRTLENREWQVAEAENGIVALQKMKETLPNLVLLDLMMPEMDGFEFLSHMRKEESWRTIPVVVITAKTLTKDDHKRLNEGYVEKLIDKSAPNLEAVLANLDETLIARQRTEPV